MTNRRKRRFAITSLIEALVIAVLLLAITSGPAFAQAVNAGEIRGTVTDPSGAVLPEVNVSILSTQTGVKTEVLTNVAGIYSTPSLLPGNYTLTFSKDGFTTFVRQGIDLRIQIITVNAQLELGATTQMIEVSAQAPLLRTESAEQGSTLLSDTIIELPNIGQNWSNFNKMLPGVVGSGQNISVNGSQNYQQSFLSDGGNVVLPRSNNMDYLVLYESIEQVEIITSNFNAQYGSGAAVFNQITKSGTNEFHGSAYWYTQNDFFNARSFFQSERSRTRWNQYGATGGGPVVRNRLFFFLNYDSTLSRRNSQGFTTYPTQDMRDGDFSYAGFLNTQDGSPRLIYDPASLSNGVRAPFPGNQIPPTNLDPLAKKMQDYWPLPNREPGQLDENYYPLPNQAGVVYNNYYYFRNRVSHPYTYLWKIDYSVTSSNRLSASMMRQKSKTITDETYRETWPMDNTDSISGGITAQITDVWTISPTIVNEFRTALIRQSIRMVPASQDKGYIQQLGITYALGDVFPNVTIGGPIGNVSIGPGTRATMGETTYAPSDIITIMRGRHIIKAGGQMEMNADNGGDWGDITSAAYSFDPTFTTQTPGDSSKSGLAYADFLTGQVSRWNAELSPVVGIRMRTAQMFVQDDFKIRPNLTINFGVRYEFQGGWSEVGNRLAIFDPTITNPATNTPGAMWYAGDGGRINLQKNIRDTFLPRAGFAWVPRGKWSVRGAFGMFTHRWGADVYAVKAVRNPTAFYTTGLMQQTDNVNPVFVFSDPNPTLNLFVPTPGSRTPDALNGQTVAYFPYNTPLSKLYQWSFGIQRELASDMIAEASYIGNIGTNLTFPRDFNQVPENLLGPGDAQLRRPYPQFQNIDGNGFDNHSNYNALQVSFRKRFSKGLSLDANYTWSKNFVYSDATGHGGSSLYQNAHDLDASYGLSNNDRPHAFKMNFVYELPAGRGKWLLSQGGPLDAVLGGWQVSGIFIRQSGSPFTPTVGTGNNSGALAGSWFPDRIGEGSLSNPTIDRWFDTSAFAVPAPYTFGNSGRNILRGPASTILDASFSKKFGLSKLREGMELQLRMDATNILNHPIFSNPNTGIGTSSAGRITSTQRGIEGRLLQLGARFRF